MVWELPETIHYCRCCRFFEINQEGLQIYIHTNMKVIRTSVRESLFQSQVIKLLGRDMEERYEAISAAESVIEESMTHLGQKKKLESCLTNKEGA